MRYTSCLMPMHLALHSIAAECGVHATAMGVHPGIQGMAPHFPDTQMHAGMHAGMHTSMHFLVRADALMRYASCLICLCIAFGRRKVACMRLLWACIQALRGCLCTCLHAGMHADLVALSPVPCASQFRRVLDSFVQISAACTPYARRRACLHAKTCIHTCVHLISC